MNDKKPRKPRPKLTAEQAAEAKAKHADVMARIEDLVGAREASDA